MPFQQVPILFWALPYYLALQGAPGSSCIFPARTLESRWRFKVEEWHDWICAVERPLWLQCWGGVGGRETENRTICQEVAALYSIKHSNPPNGSSNPGNGEEETCVWEIAGAQWSDLTTDEEIRKKGRPKENYLSSLGDWRQVLSFEFKDHLQSTDYVSGPRCQLLGTEVSSPRSSQCGSCYDIEKHRDQWADKGCSSQPPRWS